MNPQTMIHEEERDGGITLSDIESVWAPIAKTGKFGSQQPYYAGTSSSGGSEARGGLRENHRSVPSRLGKTHPSATDIEAAKRLGGGDSSIPTSP
jgi:hypothetical protein